MKVGAVILAAGAGSRFGGDKLLATLDGRPLIRHVIAAAAAGGLDPIVVVVPPSGPLAELDLAPARRVENPTPQEGLSESVRLGLRALDASASDPVDAAIILPADQPRVRPAVIQALIDAAELSPRTPFVVPRYAHGGAPNPVLASRSIWRLADELVGDRGFGPVLATHEELVRTVRVEGANPDVDTPDDLARLVEARDRAADVS
jgi:molybdenum cofactor cytidylyltransferase